MDFVNCDTFQQVYFYCFLPFFLRFTTFNILSTKTVSKIRHKRLRHIRHKFIHPVPMECISSIPFCLETWLKCPPGTKCKRNIIAEALSSWTAHNTCQLAISFICTTLYQVISINNLKLADFELPCKTCMPY